MVLVRSSNFLFIFVHLIFFDVHILYMKIQNFVNPSCEINLLKLLITLKYKIKTEFTCHKKRRKKEGKLVQQLAEHQMEGLQDKWRSLLLNPLMLVSQDLQTTDDKGQHISQHKSMPTWNKEQNSIKIHHRGKFKTEDETLLRTNLGGKSSLVPCFLHVYCFHPDFSLHPQFHSVPSVRMTLHNSIVWFQIL